MRAFQKVPALVRHRGRRVFVPGLGGEGVPVKIRQLERVAQVPGGLHELDEQPVREFGTYCAFPKSRHTVCPYKTDTFLSQAAPENPRRADHNRRPFKVSISIYHIPPTDCPYKTDTFSFTIRDTLSLLQSQNVTALTDFDWVAQLRYYWEQRSSQLGPAVKDDDGDDDEDESESE